MSEPTYKPEDQILPTLVSKTISRVEIAALENCITIRFTDGSELLLNNMSAKNISYLAPIFSEHDCKGYFQIPIVAHEQELDGCDSPEYRKNLERRWDGGKLRRTPRVIVETYEPDEELREIVEKSCEKFGIDPLNPYLK